MSIIISIFFSFIFASIQEPFAEYKEGKFYRITSIELAPIIDGRLDDDCWDNAEVIDSFTQTHPNYGSNPTEKLEVQIVQDDYAIYVSARLLDSSPELITQKLVNRYDFTKLTKSDWFCLSIYS